MSSRQPGSYPETGLWEVMIRIPDGLSTDRERCSLSDNWRLGGAVRIDRVQANLRFTSELY